MVVEKKPEEKPAPPPAAPKAEQPAAGTALPPEAYMTEQEKEVLKKPSEKKETR